MGDAAPHRHRRTRGHLPRVPGHARRPSRRSRITAVADLDASRSAAVAAELPGAAALSVEDLLAQPGRATRCSTSRSPRRTPRSRSARSRTARTSTARSRWPPTFPDARAIIDGRGRGRRAGRVRAGHRPGHRHPDGAGGDRRRAHRPPDRRVGRHGHARATSAGIRTPTSTTAAGGGPLLDMGPYYVAALIHLLGPVRAVDRRRQPAARRARHRLRPARGRADPGRGGQPCHRRARARQRRPLDHHDELRRRRDDRRADRGARRDGHPRRARSEPLRRRGAALRTRRHRVAHARRRRRATSTAPAASGCSTSSPPTGSGRPARAATSRCTCSRR